MKLRVARKVHRRWVASWRLSGPVVRWRGKRGSFIRAVRRLYKAGDDDVRHCYAEIRWAECCAAWDGNWNPKQEVPW